MPEPSSELRMLSPREILQIEQICDAFELAWRRGESPHLEQVVQQLAPHLQRLGLRHLLTIELEYRSRDGQAAPRPEYEQRFPNALDIVEQVHRDIAAADCATVHANRHAVPDTVDELPADVSYDSAVAGSASFDKAEDRYELHERVGEGGVGVVYRCLDRKLGRELALKLLREEHAHRSDMLGRFMAEAQIGSQLQHPGVASVYEQGRFEDGRPYFTMKLVQGRTLSEVLKDRSSEQHDMLGVFEQVCQTIAYAHSRGVVHRDLKPANIMLGSFGEVQVMDWGLAKVMHQAEPTTADSDAGTRPVQTGRLRSQVTQIGALIGTPAYMPPEQARGEMDRIDPRADVFGLGAILCELLTGSPPNVGTADSHSSRIADESELAATHQRIAVLDIDDVLRSLLLSCLESDLEKRPKNAAIVAQQMSSYLESIRQKLRDERLAHERNKIQVESERRRRKLWLGIAIAVCGMIASSSVGLLYWQNQKSKRQRDLLLARQSIARAVAQVESGDFMGARMSLDVAYARQGEHEKVQLGQDYEQLTQAVELALELERVERERTTPTSIGLFDNARALREYEEAFQRFGIGLKDFPADELAKRINQSEVRNHILAALDNWALVCAYRTRFDAANKETYIARRDEILDVARLVDPHPELRDHIRNPAIWSDRDQLEQLGSQVTVGELSPRLAAFLGELIRFSGGDPVPLLRIYVAKHPDDFWLNFDIAKVLTHRQPEECLRYYQAALALRPDHLFVLGNMGFTYLSQGETEKACQVYERALEVDPNYLAALSNLGSIYESQGNVAKAIEFLSRSVALAPERPNYQLLLALSLQETGQIGKALDHYRLAIKGFQEYDVPTMYVMQGRPVTTEQLNGYAHYCLANALRIVDDNDAAIHHYNRATELRPDDAETYLRLGAALLSRGDFQAAVEQITKGHEMGTSQDDWEHPSQQQLDYALRCAKHQDDIDGGTFDARDADSRLLVAEVHYFQGRLVDAVESYRQLLEQDPQRGDERLIRFRAASAAIAAEAAVDSKSEAKQLRDLALQWMVEDLEYWTAIAEEEGQLPSNGINMLNRWIHARHLASVREPDRQEQLSDEDRAAWQDAWKRLTATLEETAEAKLPQS